MESIYRFDVISNTTSGYQRMFETIANDDFHKQAVIHYSMEQYYRSLADLCKSQADKTLKWAVNRIDEQI